jgi:hypothetical protein
MQLHESSVRRHAQRRGYLVRKSRQRKFVPNLNNRGEYMLIEARRNLVVLGEQFNATLEDIAAYLNGAEGVSLS